MEKTFIEILNTPEAYALIERIEELIGEEEPVLCRIRSNLINQLKADFGYSYKA